MFFGSHSAGNYTTPPKMLVKRKRKAVAISEQLGDGALGHQRPQAHGLGELESRVIRGRVDSALANQKLDL